jgi:hypothetical protein
VRNKLDFENFKIGLLIFLGVVNLPVYWFLGKVFFGDLATFWELLKTSMVPDLISMFRGKYWEDWAATARINLYFVMCGGLLFLEYYLVIKHFYNVE